MKIIEKKGVKLLLFVKSEESAKYNFWLIIKTSHVVL